VITHVFVYGTLQPGQPRWPSLQRFVVGESKVGSAAGVPYDTGDGWPAATFDPRAKRTVPGVVVELLQATAAAALATLDAIEGVEGGLFDRIQVDIDGEPCWSYHWPASTSDFRVIPRWPFER
jgi:gamma-glutamylcyclotransferase (GGCT)/AIG2-like uncharacterized protein YtfP